MTSDTNPVANELALANERFALVARATHDVIWDWDLVSDTVWWNDTLYRLFGVSPDEVTSRIDFWYSRIHPDDRDRIQAIVRQTIDQRASNWSAEYRFQRADGTYVLVHTQAYLAVHNGEATRLIGAITTSSERPQQAPDATFRFSSAEKNSTGEKQQRNPLHNINQLYQVAFDNASVGVAILDPYAHIQLVNKKFSDMIGYKPEELTGVHFSAISHADELEINKKLVLQLRNREIPSYVLDKRYIRKDGRIIWARLNSAIVWNPDGTPNSLVSIILDITTEVQARQELKEAEESLRMAVDLAQLGTWRFSLIAEEWSVSERIKEWMGFQAGDPITITDFFEGVPNHEIFTQFIENARQSPQQNLLDIEYELKNRKSSSQRIMHSRGQVLFDKQNMAYAIVGTTQDVTSQRQTEQELEQQVQARTQALQQATDRVNQQAEQLRLVTDSALTAISLYAIVRDETTGEVIDLRYELMNQMALRLTGRRSDELIGKTMHQVFPGIAASGLWLQYKALAESEHGTNVRFQNHYVHEGYDIWYEVQGVREDEFIVLSFLDITELKQTQLKLEALNLDLRRSNENLQQFAYVASHDLQEPLRKIEAFGNILKDQYAGKLSETGVDLLTRMQGASTRMATLIKDLLSYSRLTSDQQAQSSVALDQVLDWVMSNLDVAITESGATINRTPLPVVNGDESQLRQLFQNLLSNAIKFRRSDQSPFINITADQVPADELPAVGRPTRPAALYYRIQVSDNGIGFDEQYRSRIFQVFQRLHSRSQYAGTGIGLAIVQKVVDNHNGMISATSEPGEGATFSVYLPT